MKQKLIEVNTTGKQCILSNLCGVSDCCHFCKTKCEMRCTDDIENCVWRCDDLELIKQQYKPVISVQPKKKPSKNKI